MSDTLALAELARRMEAFGPVAYLVTVGPDEVPHVVSVTVAWDRERVVVHPGRTSTANVERHPAATLLWPAPAGESYSLIVDGPAGSVPAAGSASAAITLEPRAAVLHRTPDGDPAAPSCIRLLAQP